VRRAENYSLFSILRMLSPFLCRAEVRVRLGVHVLKVLEAIKRRFPDNALITNFACLTPKMYADPKLLADMMKLERIGYTELDGLLDFFGTAKRLEGGKPQPALVDATKARSEFPVLKAFMLTQLAGEAGILALDDAERKQQLTFRGWMWRHGDQLKRYPELYKLMLIAMLVTMTSVDCERTAGPDTFIALQKTRHHLKRLTENESGMGAVGCLCRRIQRDEQGGQQGAYQAEGHDDGRADARGAGGAQVPQRVHAAVRPEGGQHVRGEDDAAQCTCRCIEGALCQRGGGPQRRGRRQR
jgi:hypothetical protein